MARTPDEAVMRIEDHPRRANTQRGLLTAFAAGSFLFFRQRDRPLQGLTPKRLERSRTPSFCIAHSFSKAFVAEATDDVALRDEPRPRASTPNLGAQDVHASVRTGEVAIVVGNDESLRDDWYQAVDLVGVQFCEDVPVVGRVTGLNILFCEPTWALTIIEVVDEACAAVLVEPVATPASTLALFSIVDRECSANSVGISILTPIAVQQDSYRVYQSHGCVGLLFVALVALVHEPIPP